MRRPVGKSIPDKPLSNFELNRYAKQLEIPNFLGVFMRDTLPPHPHNIECVIVNFNTYNQPGSHWVCYHRNEDQITPVEVQRYLKTGIEFDRGKEVIQRNTDIVQAPNTVACGYLCLYVLKSSANGEKFQSIPNHMRHYGYPQSDWKDSV